MRAAVCEQNSGLVAASAPAEALQPRGRAVAARAADRNVERPLALGELFFSTTDEKGVITAGNRVFEIVSGYPLDELIGRAHNVVRHPDMPRAVFRVLWDTIAAGAPVCAYVKNLAADGAYYWVLASVVPITGGYLSVRLAPGSEHFTLAQQLYGELTALERDVEGGDLRRRKQSIDASVARLGERLSELGYEDYGAFMRSAMPAEVARRAQRLPDRHRQALATVPSGASGAVADILSEYGSMSEFLAALVTDLSRYAAVGHWLAEQSAYLRVLGDDVRLFAINAQIGASRLGEQGAALDAVARLLTEQSQATSPLVAKVAELAASTVGNIDDMTFQVALSTVQAEMIAVFAHELTDEPEIQHSTAANMLALADGLQRGSDRTFAALKSVSEQIEDVIEHVGRVGVGIDRLARLSLNGRIEVAGVDDAGSIKTLFADVECQVRDARCRLAGIDETQRAAHELKRAASHDAEHAASRMYSSAAGLTEPVTLAAG
jgi:PAS domain S-box-containing protein